MTITTTNLPIPKSNLPIPIPIPIPKRLYDGDVYESILLYQALKDVNFCFIPDEIEDIFGVPAFGLIERILDYADGNTLEEPEALNKEKEPFWAIKYAYCDDWDDFVARNGKVEELQHLRAYFYIEKNNPKNLMCITHFIQKTQAKLDPKDTAMSRSQKAIFDRNGCYYE